MFDCDEFFAVSSCATVVAATPWRLLSPRKPPRPPMTATAIRIETRMYLIVTHKAESSPKVLRSLIMASLAIKEEVGDHDSDYRCNQTVVNCVISFGAVTHFRLRDFWGTLTI